VREKSSLTNYLLVAICASYLIQLLVPSYESNFLLYRAGIESGEYYRLLTVALLHGGLLHLGFNMYSLHLLGTPVENFYGRGRYATILLISQLAASCASIFLNTANVYSIGASGAIFGLFGSLAVSGRAMGVDFRSIGTIILINFALGFMVSGIDWRAHLGGLIGGAVATWVLRTVRKGY
jgi:membrane associated rhomboid family serine protease